MRQGWSILCASAAADPRLLTFPVSNPLYLALPHRNGWGSKTTEQNDRASWTWGPSWWCCRKQGSPCPPRREKSSGELAGSTQPCSSPLDTCREGSGIWHKVPFQMGIGLRFLSSSLFKLRERCQNLSSGEEQIVIGKNKWGKTEALDRDERGKKGKNIQFPFLSNARDISPSVFCCWAISPFLTVIFPPPLSC